ncbi:MAG TPA: PhoPQ-activated pathogenicity-like protein PqaA type, partial [Verrucomicrobiae bacterium]|nr:PhoPQ-activated pathogenicity-like protein PqaA type [Verrucomicrobiae bacterium]
SSDRDFRDGQWSSRELEAQPGSGHAVAEIKTPKNGYRAYLAEVVLTASDGHSYKLSTEARVTPDTIK